MIGDLFFDVSIFEKVIKKCLGRTDMSFPGSSRVMVEGDSEFLEKVTIDFMKVIDLALRGSIRNFRTESHCYSMFIRSTDIENIAANEPLKPRITISRKKSSRDMSKMQGSIGVWKGGGGGSRGGRQVSWP